MTISLDQAQSGSEEEAGAWKRLATHGDFLGSGTKIVNQ